MDEKVAQTAQSQILIPLLIVSSILLHKLSLVAFLIWFSEEGFIKPEYQRMILVLKT